MFRVIKAYQLGKRIEKLHDQAKTVLLVKFTALQDLLGLEEGTAAIMVCFLFEEDLGERMLSNDLMQHSEEIEPAVDEIFRHEPELKQLVSATLFLKLNMCRAYGNRPLYDKMLASPVFNKYCDFKSRLDDRSLDDLASLIARVQSNFFR